MASPLRKRLFKGFGANAYGQITTVIVQLAGVPILLHYWGMQLYGEWLILSAIPTYLSMTDLGFAQSAGNDMTQHMGRGDRASALVVFQSISVLIAVCSLISLLVVIGVLALTPITSWFHMRGISPGETSWVLGLLATEVLIKLNVGTLRAGFCANGDYALYAVTYVSTLLAQYVGIWISVSLGGELVAAAVVFLTVRIIATSVMGTVIVFRYPWLPIGYKHARRKELRRLAKPALASLAIPLAQGLNIQGMILVVGAVLGPIAVVTFSTLRTLSRLILQTVQNICNVAEPEFATAYGAKTSELLRRLYVLASQITFWLAVVLAVCLLLFGAWILKYWTHGKVAMDFSLYVWLLITAVAGSLWWTNLTVLQAANLHMKTAVVFVLAASIAIVVAYGMLETSRAVQYAGLSLLIMDIIMIGYVLPTASRICGVSPGSVLRNLINPLTLLSTIKTFEQP